MQLSDAQENPHLNQTIRSIKAKLGGPGAPLRESVPKMMMMMEGPIGKSNGQS